MTAALAVGHRHRHSQAPVAPPEVMAYLNGEPVSRELVDDRLAVLRAGDAACVLPRPDSREGRQLTRWVAQLVITEQLAYAADVLGQDPPDDPVVPVADWHRELLQSARLEAFARWLNAAMHDRVQLVRGLEHPGDSNQPDNLHRH